MSTRVTARSTISRREPVIALEPFRYRGRNYKEGGYLDRRRCRMPHSKLVRLLRENVCCLAKDMDPEKLAEYGFIYNNMAPRLKLTIIENDTPESNQKLIDALFPDDGDDVDGDDVDGDDVEEDDESPEPTLKHVGGGWYDVMVNNNPVNDAGMRKNDALIYIESYEGEE